VVIFSPIWTVLHTVMEVGFLAAGKGWIVIEKFSLSVAEYGKSTLNASSPVLWTRTSGAPTSAGRTTTLLRLAIVWLLLRFLLSGTVVITIVLPDLEATPAA